MTAVGLVTVIATCATCFAPTIGIAAAIFPMLLVARFTLGVAQAALFPVASGANREAVERMFTESGAFIFGRRTYEIANGWGGRHPVNGAPTFVLTHHPPPDYPRGPSNLTFVTDGIQSAIRQARAVAGGKDIKLGGASPAQQALAAELCDEILIHLAPCLLGDGVRLFSAMPDGIRLEKLSASDGPFATHLRYRIIKDRNRPPGVDGAASRA